MSSIKYLGIDLGTSNSAVAVFENGEIKPILNAHGAVNTPSVVRATQTGIVVGEKAKKRLFKDPENTFKEFKRIIGTKKYTKADRTGREWLAEELSAEVLKHLKQIAEEQESCTFDKVVVTVPALFELPQSNATAEAARLAGFEQVELIPEPVASGLAAGWDSSNNQDAWLVYDLGGGTFDVSLLESRDGLLRVVAHDGDNFLGGRDIDRAIVNWLFEFLSENHQLELSSASTDFAKVKRHFEAAAEKAKIVLSATKQTVVELEFEFEDEDYEFDVPLTREKLTSLAEPIIQKSIDICLRLVKSQGLGLDKLTKVVLVGGPAHMPQVQEAVSAQLAPLAESAKDPMSLVSQGAAIYSATIDLGCNSNEKENQKVADYQVWLQYPSVCTELNPTLMGKVVDDKLGIDGVMVSNSSGHWQSEKASIDSSGVFIIELAVRPGSNNVFEISGYQGNTLVPISHQKVNIVHGLTMSDPPLSRSIGLALADGSVKTFIERGTALPAKRTFIQNVVDTLVPGNDQSFEIPIVQGERRQSRFCRKVGSLLIEANILKHTLHVGSPIEITIDVDRGGNLNAQAKIVDQSILVEGVANLVMGTQSPDALKSQAQSLNTRVSSILQEAFRNRDDALINLLTPLSGDIQSILKDLLTLQDDDDTCQRISRNLIDIESEIELIELRDQLVELKNECETIYFSTSQIVNEFGDQTDKKILDNCAEQMNAAMTSSRQGELERIIERLEQLYHSAHSKSPYYWKDLFLSWASYVDVATNPKQARKLVDSGYKQIGNDNLSNLRSITLELFNLIPNQYKNNNGPGSYESGIY